MLGELAQVNLLILLYTCSTLFTYADASATAPIFIVFMFSRLADGTPSSDVTVNVFFNRGVNYSHLMF